MKLAVGFDLETTGLSQPDGHRIVEIAAIVYDLETKNMVGKFVQRVNPQRPIDPAAQAVHGITFESVAHEPTWEEVAPKLKKILHKAEVIIAHNGKGFDMPFVNGEFNRIGIGSVNAPLVDTMLQARWATPMGKLPNLGELCFACGVDYDPSKAHAADYDVKVMMESFFVGLEGGFFTIPQDELLPELGGIAA